jgi:integrase
MPRRKRLTDSQVAALPPKAVRYTYPDPELPAHYIRVYPTGTKTFVVVRNNKWTKVGDTRRYTIEGAREKARTVLRGESAPESFATIARLYEQRHVSKLRSASEVKRHLDRLIDAFGDRDFASVRRKDITALADKVAEKHGTRAAKYLLQTVSALSRWYALRDEGYLSPMAPGMTKAFKSKSRARILDDNELRAVWTAAEDAGQFGALIRLLLLTGQRREKVAAMRWQDIDDNGVWIIPHEEGEKANAGTLVLPQAAVDIIRSEPRLGDNPHVLAGRTGSHINGFSKPKRKFDRDLGKMPPWVLHDLRRTARSLMAKAGVRSDHAERTMGHTIKGVEGTYDRHAYVEQKAAALKALASLIDNIVRGQPDRRVVKMRARH